MPHTRDHGAAWRGRFPRCKTIIISLIIMACLPILAASRPSTSQPLRSWNSPRAVPSALPISWTSNSQIAAYPGIQGAGTPANPWRVENVTITDTIVEDCVRIVNTTDSILIKNCTFNASIGNCIYIYGASSISFENCTVNQNANDKGDLQILDCHNLTFQNFTSKSRFLQRPVLWVTNSFDLVSIHTNLSILAYDSRSILVDSNDDRGMIFDNCSQVSVISGYFAGFDCTDSHDITVNNCTSEGIFEIHDSTGVNISRNTIKSSGLFLVRSNDSIIEGNTIERSNELLTGFGISGFNNRVINNTMYNLTEIQVGYITEQTANNTFFLNSLINFSQIYNYGTNNTWDNGTLGNYWSDYSTRYPSATSPGGTIMDTPYTIYQNGVDRYPLAAPASFNPAPIASFTANTTNITMRHDVQFTYRGTCGSLPATFSWDFGDGGHSNAPSPAHTYAMPGTYSVTLNVTDHDGQSSILSRAGLVFVQDFLPNAQFSVTPSAGTTIYPNDTVSFLFTGSAGDGPATLAWDFGDNTTTINDTHPHHQYALPGNYTATLVVTDQDLDNHTYKCIVVVVARHQDPGNPIDWPLVASIAAVAGLVGVPVSVVAASRGKAKRRRA